MRSAFPHTDTTYYLLKFLAHIFQQRSVVLQAKREDFVLCGVRTTITSILSTEAMCNVSLYLSVCLFLSFSMDLCV